MKSRSSWKFFFNTKHWFIYWPWQGFPMFSSIWNPYLNFSQCTLTAAPPTIAIPLFPEIENKLQVAAASLTKPLDNCKNVARQSVDDTEGALLFFSKGVYTLFFLWSEGVWFWRRGESGRLANWQLEDSGKATSCSCRTASDAGCRMLNVGCSMLNAEY